MQKYDVVIIGAGPAGLAAAYPLKAAGKDVAVIENDLWGGTCPNRGCDPKKVLLSGVEARDKMNQLVGKGFKAAPYVNWVELEAFKETFTDPVSENSKKGLVNAGITTIVGTPEFMDTDKLQVNGTTIQAGQFILATGQRPSLPNIIGKEHLLTSTDFLSLKQMPAEIAIVGGGYIAFELATIANATGAKVHMILHNDRPLKAFDPKQVDALVAQLQQKGVEFHFNIATKRIVQAQGKYELEADNFKLATNLIFAATGRIPNLETLNLEKAQVQTSPKGILVNQTLQTSNPKIYAIGDVVAKKHPKLTPVAGFEARYVAEHLNGATDEIGYPLVPTVVYGSPELAQIGLSVAEANAHPDQYEIKVQDLTDWFTYHRTNEPIAKATTILDQKGCLVGASVLSSEAAELINLFTFAIAHKVTHKKVNELIMAYPTVASDLQYLI